MSSELGKRGAVLGAPLVAKLGWAAMGEGKRCLYSK